MAVATWILTPPSDLTALIDLTVEAIDTATLLQRVTTPQCGAEVLFVGTTRQWTGGEETQYLDYECYQEMALKMLASLELQARQRFSIQEVAIVHRLGRVEIGQASVAVAVGAAHRDAAFEAARWLIDEIKKQVPIWKRDTSRDQTQQWVHPQ